MNIDSIPGSVGFASVLFPFVYPVRLIRVDDETGEVVRNPDTGLCVLCHPGEPGEFVGKIVKNHPSRSFDGYVNAQATQKKIVYDVLRKGDLWFRSGDLLTMDEFGWMYFMDRLGDTYRWKGENVSTMEVEAVISGCLRLQDAISYGVEVSRHARTHLAVCLPRLSTLVSKSTKSSSHVPFPVQDKFLLFLVSELVDFNPS